ncbi:MAG: heat shock protein HspQ [Alphaproteobacteria bacterium]|nr:heat shock protein HspQ [Alphaproteobacteria bacterium]
MRDRVNDGKFGIGQLVHHRLFDYRGVIFDVDPVFQGSEEWYETVARSHPPKDQPWYHLLVHQGTHTTYVAERNLEADSDTAPIVHPALDQVFSAFEDGAYAPRRRGN